MNRDLKKLKDLLGTQARIASALHLTTEHVSRMSTGKVEVPEYIGAIAELLELVPHRDWPKRWK